MNCGACGGRVRGYSGTLHGRPIKDWKHATVPPGTKPHRPILGTPVDQATLDRIHRPPTPEETPVAEEVVRPPLVPPRPALATELEDSQSATQILRLLESNRWALVEEPAYFQVARGDEYLVIKGRRNDVGAVVSYRRRPDKPWAFEEAYQLGVGGLRRVGSEQLKNWITQRDERCPDCGRSSIAHEGGECP